MGNWTSGRKIKRAATLAAAQGTPKSWLMGNATNVIHVCDMNHNLPW